jgi:hypothetical protein
MAGVALVLLPVLAVAAEDAKPLNVELKTFTFKVAEGMPADSCGYNAAEEKLFFFTNGTATAPIKVPEDGDYEIVVKASGDDALKEGAKFKLAVDGKPSGKETETGSVPKEYKFPTALKAGEHKLSIEFTNDVYKENVYDRNLYVQAVTLKRTK